MSSNKHLSISDIVDELDHHWKICIDGNIDFFETRWLTYVQSLNGETKSKAISLYMQLQKIAQVQAYEIYRHNYASVVELNQFEKETLTVTLLDPFFNMKEVDPDYHDEELDNHRLFSDGRWVYCYGVLVITAIDTLVSILSPLKEPHESLLVIDKLQAEGDSKLLLRFFSIFQYADEIKRSSKPSDDESFIGLEDIPGVSKLQAIRQLDNPFHQLIPHSLYTLTKVRSSLEFIFASIFTLIGLAIAALALLKLEHDGLITSTFLNYKNDLNALEWIHLRLPLEKLLEQPWVINFLTWVGFCASAYLFCIMVAGVLGFLSTKFPILKKQKLQVGYGFVESNIDSEQTPLLTVIMANKHLVEYTALLPERDRDAVLTYWSNIRPFEADVARYGIKRFGRKKQSELNFMALSKLAKQDWAASLKPLTYYFRPREKGVLITSLLAASMMFSYSILPDGYKLGNGKNPEVSLPINITESFQEGKVLADSLRLRSCPSTECNVIGGSSNGELFYILDKKDGWYMISKVPERNSGQETWVSSHFIEILKNKSVNN